MFRSVIRGIAHQAPSKVLSNDDLAKIVETSDEWIRTRTGIRSRAIVDREKGENHLYLCRKVTDKVLAQAGWAPKDIDLIVLGTTSPDTWMPNASCRLSADLGLNVAGIDINAACSSFLYSLHVADSLIRSGVQKRVLVVGAEVLSSAVNWKDRTTCVLFGDGAGAMLLEGVPEDRVGSQPHVVASRIFSHEDKGENLSLKAGGSRTPFGHPRYNVEDSPFISMNGQEVFKVASKSMAHAAKEVLGVAGWRSSDLSWFVPHQANLRIIEMVAKLLDFPMDKTYVNIDRWGNTSAASIPICLSELWEAKKLSPGSKVLADVFGGGFTYGAAALQF